MKKQKSTNSLAGKMVIALILGIVVGFCFMWLRETLNSSGNEAVWSTINNILFQDITAEGANSAIGFSTSSANISGLTASEGSTSSNPLLVILNVVPSNVTAVFSNNTAVLAVVFLAVCLGLCMNVVGEEKSSTLKKLFTELNNIIVVFLNFIVTKIGPFAIFVLISRTFATYGIDYLRPALVYVITTVILLLIYLFLGYALIIRFGTKLNPMPFVKKISKVAMFGFSTSSSAAALPLNLETTSQELGVDEKIASFVLPLGMTINMNGTAIMQVIATLFVAGCSGQQVTIPTLIMIAVLALLCSAGTPAAPGAGAVILFTILSGFGFTSDTALLAYSLILAINRPIEMLCTSLNVVGDSCTCIYVAKSEGMLNENVYNSPVKYDLICRLHTKV